MSDVYLLTGFLGAGKTTFLRNFVQLFRDKKLRLIINEFGRENVDAALLADLGAVMQEITGGSVFCACRIDQFEKALRECGEDETVLLESSGLSDPTGVRKLLSGGGRFPHLQYKGGICIADATRFHKVYETARPCVRQLAASDIVLINKCDIAPREQIDRVRELILGQRPDIPVFETSFGALPPKLLETLEKSQNGDREGLPITADLSSRKMSLRIPPEITAYELEMFIRSFAEDTYRVKGFAETCDKGTVLADCVANVVSVRRTELKVDRDRLGILDILSGNRMPMRSSVKKACELYGKYNISVVRE
ncbi:MAG: CobW family GTP-binding protein [Candidatus Limivicinus sp.]|jgi:G3E family GTPase